jgi:hypothetical protein
MLHSRETPAIRDENIATTVATVVVEMPETCEVVSRSELWSDIRETYLNPRIKTVVQECNH